VLVSAFLLLFLLGAASTALRAIGQSVLLGHARPDMRGRVSALLSVAFLGTTLIGGPLIGFLTDLVGVRLTFVIVGSGVLATSLGTYPTLRAELGRPQVLDPD
jgi:MFS family permease